MINLNDQFKSYIKTMLPYSLKCRKNTESKNPNAATTKNRRIMLLSKFALRDSKKSKFIKEQEARGLLSKLAGIKVPILCDLSTANMNAIVNTFLLTGDKFVAEMHLRQSWFTSSASERFNKNKEIIKNSKETEDWRYIYQNELDKACFQRNMTYGGFEDLNGKTAADKVLCDKAFKTAENPQYNGYPRRVASMVYTFLIKRLLVEQLKRNHV